MSATASTFISGPFCPSKFFTQATPGLFPAITALKGQPLQCPLHFQCVPALGNCDTDAFQWCDSIVTISDVH